MRSGLKQLDSFTLEMSKSHRIRSFLRSGRLKVDSYMLVFNKELCYSKILQKLYPKYSVLIRSETFIVSSAPRTLSSRSKVSKISKFSEKSIERPSFPPPKLNAEKSKSKKKSKSRRKKSKKSKSRVLGAEKLADPNTANYRIDRIGLDSIQTFYYYNQ